MGFYTPTQLIKLKAWYEAQLIRTKDSYRRSLLESGLAEVQKELAKPA